jgi:hypothetical protein
MGDGTAGRGHSINATLAMALGQTINWVSDHRRKACDRSEEYRTSPTVPPTNRGNQMADEDLKAELERLKAENERLKGQRGRSVSLKVSEKVGVSVYGLGRFPVTLSRSSGRNCSP